MRQLTLDECGVTSCVKKQYCRNLKACFCELPCDVKRHIMLLRLQLMVVEKARRNLPFWKKSLLIDMCKWRALPYKGTVAEIRHRLRDHRKLLDETLIHNSIAFWENGGKRRLYPVTRYWSHWKDDQYVDEAYIIETREEKPLFHW